MNSRKSSLSLSYVPTYPFRGLGPSNYICTLCFAQEGKFFYARPPCTYEILCKACGELKASKGTQDALFEMYWLNMYRSLKSFQLFKERKGILESLERSFEKCMHDLDIVSEKSAKTEAKLEELITEKRNLTQEGLNTYQNSINSKLNELLSGIKSELFLPHLSFTSPASRIIQSMSEKSDIDLNPIKFSLRQTENAEDSVSKCLTLNLTDPRLIFTERTLCMLPPESNVVYSLSLWCKSCTITRMPITAKWRCSGSWLLLPSNKIFYCGGKDAYILDLTTSKAEQCSNCTPVKHNSLCEFENKVYSFGTYQVFCLKTRGWQRFDQGPFKASSITSTVKMLNHILVAELYEPRLYRYSPGLNTYAAVPAPLTKQSIKLLLKGKKGMYCLSQDQLLVADTEGRAWSISNNIKNFDWWSSCAGVQLGQYVYFITGDDFRLWALDEVHRTVSQVGYTS